MPTVVEQPDETSAAGTVTQNAPHSGGTSNRLVPDSVGQRFLRIGDRYFFPDRTLAFVDRGERLDVRSNNLEVVHGIVAIMQARGWRSVRLTGTAEFRRQVWHAATLQGIGVQGFAPTSSDMQHLQHALDREHRPQEQRTAADTPETLTSRNTRDHERGLRPGGLRPPAIGVLVAHAAAHYRFDPTQRLSYYVRVKTETGERVWWGTDLERALAESQSGARVGDQIVLRPQGVKPVQVRVPDRDAAGQLLREKTLLTNRMVWSIEKVQFVETLARKAAVLRDASTGVQALLSEFPDLKGAAIGLKLAEKFAQRLAARPSDQARIVQTVRNGLADAIAQGRQVGGPRRPSPQPHAVHRSRGSPTRNDLERSLPERMAARE